LLLTQRCCCSGASSAVRSLEEIRGPAGFLSLVVADDRERGLLLGAEHGARAGLGERE
jgi:hypothetical protein